VFLFVTLACVVESGFVIDIESHFYYNFKVFISLREENGIYYLVCLEFI
jgi:hypothetical protein